MGRATFRMPLRLVRSIEMTGLSPRSTTVIDAPSASSISGPESMLSMNLRRVGDYAPVGIADLQVADSWDLLASPVTRPRPALTIIAFPAERA